MEKFNALLKPIILAFCIIIFAWLVQVTRYEYGEMGRGYATYRVDRLTGKIQTYSFGHQAWSTVSKR
jgi:hypothetical protein